MPGRAAQTRADACRSSGAATLPVQVPLRYWLVGGSAVAVSVSVSVAVSRLRPRLLVATVVLGELGHLGQHRTWRSAGGRRDRSGATRSGRGELQARLARLLLPRLHGLAAALGHAWGAETRSCSSSVLMEEPTEPVVSVHAA